MPKRGFRGLEPLGPNPSGNDYVQQMRTGEASATAKRVAAQRLTFDRAQVSFGDPASDERLARDVAGDVEIGAAPLAPYLAARTAFFDRVVVESIERGVSQIVVVAAGYDGRSLRYSKPGVRWFEVDHPDTQQDKRARLERLRIASGHVAFVAADFNLDDVNSSLGSVGHDGAAPSLFLCEGLAVYLERDVLARLLRGLRAVAAPSSRLAISLSVATSGPEQAARRAVFNAAVKAMGEPARTVLTADDADGLLAGSGWTREVIDEDERERRAGFVLLQAA